LLLQRSRFYHPPMIFRHHKMSTSRVSCRVSASRLRSLVRLETKSITRSTVDRLVFLCTFVFPPSVALFGSANSIREPQTTVLVAVETEASSTALYWFSLVDYSIFVVRSGAPTTGGRSDMQSGLLPVTVLAGWFVTTLVATAVVHSARRVS